jgi:hypothetical protein
MVANPRPINMTANPRPTLPDLQNAKYICLIVGIVCLTGFVLGMLTVSLPLGDFSLKWRIDFLHELGDRSITLILGAALTMWGLSGASQAYGKNEGFSGQKPPLLSGLKRNFFRGANKTPLMQQNQRYFLFRTLALVCLLGGIGINLLSILVIHDTLELNKQAIANINDQASSLNAQIALSKGDPTALGENVTPAVIDEASKNVKNQAESLKENAKTRITKSGAETFIYLLIVGFGLITLGRWGLS